MQINFAIYDFFSIVRRGERERDRQTDRQTDIQTQTNRKTDRQSCAAQDNNVFKNCILKILAPRVR